MIKLLLAAVIIGITSIAYADHKPTTEFDGLGWSQLPTICGTTEAVNEYLEHNKFILESVSVGKENANAEGSPVYIVTYYINEARDQSMSVITAPSGLESCMLYRSFDLSYPGMTL
tara:strand:+ start:1137 stop:1484 length:348 start_codon:yes stop_codon:yes gene_type:complete